MADPAVAAKILPGQDPPGGEGRRDDVEHHHDHTEDTTTNDEETAHPRDYEKDLVDVVIPVAEAQAVLSSLDLEEQGGEMNKLPRQRRKKVFGLDRRAWIGLIALLAVLVILCVVLPVTLTRAANRSAAATTDGSNGTSAYVTSTGGGGEEEDGDLFAYWDSINVTSAHVTYYGIEASIAGRLATTKIIVDVVNAEREYNCTAVRDLDLELPRHARVTSLTTSDNYGCRMDSRVQSSDKAERDFEEQISQGKAAGMVKARDETNYQVKLSVPPMGTSRLELVIEQLLRRRQHRVDFQIPLAPHGLDYVDHLQMNLEVADPASGAVQDFQLEDLYNFTASFVASESEFVAKLPQVVVADKQEGSSTVTASLDVSVKDLSKDHQITSALGYLPGILKGSYDPGPLPENGTLMLSSAENGNGDDGGASHCFEHLFNPPSLSADPDAAGFPRSIVFVIDVSGSMDTGTKLEDAKAAFAFMIQSLGPQDQFAVQIFSGSGTEDVWGPAYGEEADKELAVNYVYSLKTRGSTNLAQAYLDAIALVKKLQENDESSTVPIIVFLTDGEPTVGLVDKRQIAKNVVLANPEKGVKIFSLAFGYDAAMDLLLGIAIQNGGLAQLIEDGFDDSIEQMQTFYDSELGKILLADIRVDVGGDFRLVQGTNPTFPVLSAGSEITVRGLVERLSASANGKNDIIKANTTGMTSGGFYKSWIATVSTSDRTQQQQQSDASSPFSSKSRCYQSYAHSKVAELMQFRDAARVLGDDLKEYVGIECEGSLDACIEREALGVALEAGLVWPELTALVTVESDTCSAVNYGDNVEICNDGTEGGDDDEIPSSTESPASRAPRPGQPPPSAPPPPPYAQKSPVAGAPPRSGGGGGGYQGRGNAGGKSGGGNGGGAVGGASFDDAAESDEAPTGSAAMPAKEPPATQLPATPTDMPASTEPPPVADPSADSTVPPATSTTEPTEPPTTADGGGGGAVGGAAVTFGSASGGDDVDGSSSSSSSSAAAGNARLLSWVVFAVASLAFFYI